MADTTTKAILSACATVGSKLSDLAIKNGQLVFVQDKHRIALDFNDKRVFYNQIEELSTETERASMLAPVNGIYYFVIDSAVLWTYQNRWIQITTPPEDVVFIGVELPVMGSNKTLYVDMTGGISVWDDAAQEYTVVADKCGSISTADITALFED